MDRKTLNFLANLFGAAALLAIILEVFWVAFFVLVPMFEGEDLDPNYVRGVAIWTPITLAIWGIYRLLENASDRQALPPQASFDVATDSLKEMLLSGSDARLSGRNLFATDELLRSYEEVDVDWNSVWRAASERSKGVPPFGVRPYWRPKRKVPKSVLAFWGSDARLRVAEDPDTDGSLLRMMENDPDFRVRVVLANRY